MKSQKSSNPLFTLDSGEEVTFEDLLKKIYVNSEEKNNSITAVAQNLLSKAKTINDLVVIMPILVDMQKVSVANDDMLVKMAAIIQRGNNAKLKEASGNDFVMSEEEHKMLMESVREAKRNIPGESAVGDV